MKKYTSGPDVTSRVKIITTSYFLSCLVQITNMRLAAILFLMWATMIPPLVSTQATVSYLTRKDLKGLFGSEDCIEGKLLTRTSTLDQIKDQDVYVIMNSVPDNERSEYDPSVDEAQDVDSEQQKNGEDKEILAKINELAVYNSLQADYTLIKEEGPPHRRKFTVSLRLGDEHYVGEGMSIKRAKRDAAGRAFQDTKYDQPIRKKKKKKMQASPLEELEALANRRGNEVVFKTETHEHHQWIGNKTIEDSSPRLHYDGTDNYQIVFLNIGDLEFIGDGNSLEAARDDAIDQALVVLRKELVEDKERFKEEKFDVEASKSPISRVHEIGQRRTMDVSFVLTGESGPPHGKTFVTTCTVGHLTTEAEGASKKESKQNAAELMLVELEKLPFVSFSTNTKLKQGRRRKKKKPKILRPSIDIFSSVMNALNFGASENSDRPDESSSSLSKESTDDESTKETFGDSSRSDGRRRKSTNDKSTNGKASGKPTHRLINLSKKLGFRFEFVDFNRGDDDALSFVSLKTDPQKVCYGIGLSQRKARDVSALAALKLLHDLELDEIHVAEKETAEYETLRDRYEDAEPRSVVFDAKGL